MTHSIEHFLRVSGGDTKSTTRSKKSGRGEAGDDHTDATLKTEA